MSLGSGSKTDTNEIYIRNFQEYFYVKLLTSQKIFTLALEDKNNPGIAMEFQPNLGSYYGFGFYIFNIGIDVLFNSPPGPEENALYGSSKARDWQIHAYARKFGADLTYQKFKGFYLSDPQIFYKDWVPGDPYPQQEDMQVENIHLGMYYVMRPERYSFPSVFNHTEAQLKSGGSILMSGQISVTSVHDPVSIIPITDTNQIEGLENLTDVNVNSIDVLPGYSYNIIIKRAFYLNLSLSLGIGYQFRSYSTDQHYTDNTIGIANTWRIGAGYNGRRFFTGISGYTQRNSIEIQNLKIAARSGFVRIFIGYRFREWGVMQKNVFDLFSRNKNK